MKYALVTAFGCALAYLIASEIAPAIVLAFQHASTTLAVARFH